MTNVTVEQIIPEIINPFPFRDFVQAQPESARAGSGMLHAVDSNPVAVYLQVLGYPEVRVGPILIACVQDEKSFGMRTPGWVNDFIGRIERQHRRSVRYSDCERAVVDTIRLIQRAEQLRKAYQQSASRAIHTSI